MLYSVNDDHFSPYKRHPHTYTRIIYATNSSNTRKIDETKAEATEDFTQTKAHFRKACERHFVIFH